MTAGARPRWQKRGVPVGYPFLALCLPLLDPEHVQRLGPHYAHFLRLVIYRVRQDGAVAWEGREALSPDDVVALLGLEADPNGRRDARGRRPEYLKADRIIARLVRLGYVTSRRTARGRTIQVCAPWSAMRLRYGKRTRPLELAAPANTSGDVVAAVTMESHAPAWQSPRPSVVQTGDYHAPAWHRAPGEANADRENRANLQSAPVVQDLESKTKTQDTTHSPDAGTTPARAREAIAAVVVGIPQPENLKTRPESEAQGRGDTGLGLDYGKAKAGEITLTSDQGEAIAALDIEGERAPLRFTRPLAGLLMGSSLAGALIRRAWPDFVASLRAQHGARGRPLARYLDVQDDGEAFARELFDRAAALDPRGVAGVKTDRERRRKEHKAGQDRAARDAAVAAMPAGVQAGIRRARGRFAGRLPADALEAIQAEAVDGFHGGAIKNPGGWMDTRCKAELASREAESVERRALEARRGSAGGSADPRARAVLQTLSGRLAMVRGEAKPWDRPGREEPAADAPGALAAR